jgi:hypothetical protein
MTAPARRRDRQAVKELVQLTNADPLVLACDCGDRLCAQCRMEASRLPPRYTRASDLTWLWW